MGIVGKVLAVIALILVAGMALMVWWHMAWLRRQSPSGIWRAQLPSGVLTLEFAGGPNEGTYQQLMEDQSGASREFGHWVHSAGTLRLVIMATDVKDHPEFGVSTPYRVRYLGPDQIGIDGPSRPGIVFDRAPEGRRVEIEPFAT